LLARRSQALLVIALLTMFLGWHASALRIDPGVESMIPVGADLEGLRELHALFGSDEVIVLALHSDKLFSLESLRRLDRLTRRVATFPHVANVLSPTNVRDLEGDELGPVPVVPYAEVVAGKLRPDALGERLAAHPIFGSLLVAKDARTAAILVELQPSTNSLDPRRNLVAELRRIASEVGPDATAYVAGIPVEKVDIARYIARDQKIFVPLVFLILAIMTAALYRHLIGMLVPLAVLTVALIWMLGIFGLAGRSLNPVTSLITPVVLVMSLEGTIQLLNQYLAARARGLPISPALEHADHQMRVPCFNAALTAAIGFAALLILPIPAIRDFGLFTGVGIMIGYGLTILLTPLLLASLPDFSRNVIQTFQAGPVERGLSQLVHWVCERRATTAAGVAAILAISAIGIARIRVETDIIHALRHTSPLSTAARFIDAQLTGVNSVEILIPGVPVNDPVALGRVANLEEAIRGLDGVRKVTGLPDLIARVNRAVHRGDNTYARLPAGPGAGSDLDDFLDGLRKEAPTELHRFLANRSGEGSTLRVIARVTALDTASSQALFAQIRDAAARIGLLESKLTGSFVVFSNMSTTLVQHQVKGLAVALVLILGVMAVQFRSIRLGLLCAIPNSVPILMVYGLMGWSGIALSVPTAMIASVAIGTIVDNSIYLLARFREAFARREDYLDALSSMMQASGRAVVFSTLTLAVGFWVGVFSSFTPTVHFATLTGAVFLLGLISQFVVLPLSLILFRPLGHSRPTTARLSALLVLISTVAGVLMIGTSLAEESQHDILLKDQFGKVDGPSRHRGEAVLLIYGRAEGMRRMKAWEDRVRRAYPGTLVVLRGLDGRGVQDKKTEAEVNERLQQNVPDDIAILVDWKGDLARAYGLPDAEVSTTILDAKGRACSTVAGPVTSEALDQVRLILMRVRETGTCP